MKEVQVLWCLKEWFNIKLRGNKAEQENREKGINPQMLSFKTKRDTQKCKDKDGDILSL